LVEPKGWGDQLGGDLIGLTRDIKKVLESAVVQIWQHCGETKLDPILVYHRSEGPISEFERDAKGQIRVGLNVKGRDYCKFAYQVAHEFCHVLAGHTNEYSRLWRDTRHANQWLEECICETASIFAIRQMGIIWQTSAPFSHWSSYSSSLTEYVECHLKKPEHQLPDKISFVSWFREQEPIFRANPIAHVSDKAFKDSLRAKFVVVASQLLPLFEKSPSAWKAMTFVNLVERDQRKSLPKQLNDWQQSCTETHRQFISQIAEVFGVTLQPAEEC
jgi:hypothetical protein